MDESSLDKLREAERQGRSGYSLPLPFAVADAAAWEYLHKSDLHIQREMFTLGSVEYHISTGDTSFGSIRIRMIGMSLSQVIGHPAEASQKLNNEYRELIKLLIFPILNSLIAWMIADQGSRKIEADLWRDSTWEYQNANATTISKVNQVPLITVSFSDLATFTEIFKDKSKTKGKPRGRRHSWREDDWAWEQVNILGRPPHEVRQEWQQQIDPTRGKLADERRSFNHAIQKDKKNK